MLNLCAKILKQDLKTKEEGKEHDDTNSQLKENLCLTSAFEAFLRLQLNQVCMGMGILHGDSDAQEQWRRARLAKKTVANEYRRAAREAMPDAFFAAWWARLLYARLILTRAVQLFGRVVDICASSPIFFATAKGAYNRSLKSYSS